MVENVFLVPRGVREVGPTPYDACKTLPQWIRVRDSSPRGANLHANKFPRQNILSSCIHVKIFIETLGLQLQGQKAEIMENLSQPAKNSGELRKHDAINKYY